MSLSRSAAVGAAGVIDRSSMAAQVEWASIDAETHGAWVRASDGGRFRLLVERLPDGGWDWAIWHTDDPGLGGYGRAPTALCAMLAAEHALMRIMGECR